MYCPHCGAENDEGNRFCVNCGSSLSAEGKSSSSSITTKERLRQWIGADRRTRLITAATVVALAVAVIAFLSLDSSESAQTSSPYLKALDQICVSEKERIIRLEQETLRQQPPDLREFASVLVTIVAEWRSDLHRTPAPPTDAADVAPLEEALLRVLIDAGKLSRLIRAGNSVAEISAQAQAVDEATGNVDAAIERAGLNDCADLRVAPET